MSEIERGKDWFIVPASALCEAFGLAEAEIRQCMHDGTITSRCDAGAKLAEGQVYDAIKPMLLAMLEEAGAEVESAGPCRTHPIRWPSDLRNSRGGSMRLSRPGPCRSVITTV